MANNPTTRIVWLDCLETVCFLRLIWFIRRLVDLTSDYLNQTGTQTDIRSISARIDESKFARAISLLTSDSVVLARSQTGGLWL